MESYRARIALLAVSCLLLTSFLVEALGARQSSEFSRQLRSSELGHQRHLSSVYHVEACRWMQEATCQINPEYARHLLSHPEGNIVQNALVDEASCMAMTHEAACISRQSCSWIEQYSVHGGNIKNICQFSRIPELLTACAHPSLRRFVMGYMRCHKQLGGTCLKEEGCERVKISMNHEGCGLNGRKVLDLIMGTPASQTEFVAHLVESSLKLKTLNVPVLSLSESKEEEGKRRLLQVGESDTTLTVEDDDLSSRGTSSTKSRITGTRSKGSTEIEKSKASSDGKKKKQKHKKTGGKKDKSQPKGDSDDARMKNISFSFEISDHLKPEEVKNVKGKQDLSVEDRIRTPLMLEGPIDHLGSIDITVPVQLIDVIDILYTITSVMDEQIHGKRSIEGAVQFAAHKLEIMRFRLDSRSDILSNVWNGSDIVWWMLQSSTQSIATSHDKINQTIDRNVPVLINAVDVAQDTWRPSSGSKDGDQLDRIKRRLRKLSRHVETKSSVQKIESLDRLVAVAVKVFNETLQEFYPQDLTTEFAERHNQTWVKLTIERNKKWRAVQSRIAQESRFGAEIIDLVQGLFRVHAPRADGSSVPYLTTLESVVNQLTGGAVASRADRYRIGNLPPHLTSPGLIVWQRGPAMTADRYAILCQRAVSNLERSGYVKLEWFLAVSDWIVNLFKAVIRLIDAKFDRSTTGYSEETAVLLSLEAALNVIIDWNNFAEANKLTGAIREEHPFGRKDIMDFTLSLVGCLTLGTTSNGCRDMDRSSCRPRGLKRWDSTTGLFSETSNHSICVPDPSPYRFSNMFTDISPLAMPVLMTQIKDLYFISAYCSYLMPEVCGTDERCQVVIIADRYFGCRPSSNFTNFVVEASRIQGLAATTEACRVYMGLPVCSKVMTEQSCSRTPACIWTEGHHGINDTSHDHCMTDWVEQLNLTDPRSMNNNNLTISIDECRSHFSERDCRLRTVENVEQRSHRTLLPRTQSAIPNWLAYTLSVAVGLAVACASYIMYRALCPVADKGRKKSKGKKKGDAMPPPKLVELPFFEHALWSTSQSSSQQRDDFDFVKEAIETETSYAANSSRYSSSHAESKMEPYTSATTAEISEIQAISEELESSSESDIDENEGWTSSTEDITDDEGSFP